MLVAFHTRRRFVDAAHVSLVLMHDGVGFEDVVQAVRQLGRAGCTR